MFDYLILEKTPPAELSKAYKTNPTPKISAISLNFNSKNA